MTWRFETRSIPRCPARTHETKPTPRKLGLRQQKGTIVKTLTTVLAAALLFGTVTSAQEESSPSAALRHFQTNLDRYIALRQEATRTLPALTVTSDTGAMLLAAESLEAAIRSARRNVGAGDLFTPDIQPILRALIADTLRANGVDPSALSEDIDEAPSGTPRPVVNRRFPWVRGVAMPSCLLAVLPPLPNPVQYRVVGRDLVLVDIDADLVLDILRDAVPAGK